VKEASLLYLVSVTISQAFPFWTACNVLAIHCLRFTLSFDRNHG